MKQTYITWFAVNFKVAVPYQMKKEDKDWCRAMFQMAQSFERLAATDRCPWRMIFDKVVSKGCKISDMLSVLFELRSVEAKGGDVVKEILGREYEAIMNVKKVEKYFGKN